MTKRAAHRYRREHQLIGAVELLREMDAARLFRALMHLEDPELARLLEVLVQANEE